SRSSTAATSKCRTAPALASPSTRKHSRSRFANPAVISSQPRSGTRRNVSTTVSGVDIQLRSRPPELLSTPLHLRQRARLLFFAIQRSDGGEFSTRGSMLVRMLVLVRMVVLLRIHRNYAAVFGNGAAHVLELDRSVENMKALLQDTVEPAQNGI